MRTIAVLNQKGGVGKTTTTVNTAAALAAMGLKVVVIDLDPQAHLTIHLGVEPQSIAGGAYGVLTQSAEFEQSLMLTRPNLWLLGANINLVGAETELVTVVGREIILREAMHRCHEQFDFCLIDCAPSLGLLSLNALAAAQEVLIPLQPHFLALQGFGKLLQTVDLVNKRINRDLKVTGVLLCMFDTRASLPNEVRADIDRFLTNARGSNSSWADAQILPTFIRRNIKLAEAPSYGQTIFEYDPTCNGAADYRNVARFFLGIEPRVDGQEEAESQVEPEPEVAAEAPAAVEHEAQEVHHEPDPAPDPGRAQDGAYEPASQDHHANPAPGGAADPHVEYEAAREVSRQEYREPETIASPDPAPQPGAAPAPWDFHHRPDLALGAASTVEHNAAPERTPSESQHESESVTEHQAEGHHEAPEHPPIQIQEFELPAPPLQSYPPPAAEPSAETQSGEGDQTHPEEPRDEHGQFGY